MTFPMQQLFSAIQRKDLGIAKRLRVFLSTNVGLSTQEILDTYTKRWPIELFFRQSKSKLALDKYQIRSRQGIQRYWLLMSLVHYLCCMHSGSYCNFEEGYAALKQLLKRNRYELVPFYPKWSIYGRGYSNDRVISCAKFNICSFIVRKCYNKKE